MFNGKIREFRRALFSNRAVDIKKVRKLTADINKKIDFLRKRVEIIRHRVSLKTATSPLLIMIEDFQFGFPHLLRLKLSGGRTQKRMHGVRIHFRSSICMEKLCFEDVNALIAHHDGNRCGTQLLSETVFYASSKASRMLALSPGKILSISEGQPINIVFNRNSEHVSIEFEAWVRILGLRKSTNATLDKTQLSLEVKGDIFTRFPTEINVVAKIKEAEDWNSLVYSVEGKMPKSSVLPNYLKEEINKYVFSVTEHAKSRIQKAETAITDAKRKTEEAGKLLNSKQITLDNGIYKLGDKMDDLAEKRITYAQRVRKIRFNSTLTRYLRFKNQTVCEMKNCKYIKLKTRIPKLCRKSIETTNKVPTCKKVTEEIDIIVMTTKEEQDSYDFKEPDKYHVDEGNWRSDSKLHVKKGKTTQKKYTKITNVPVTKKREIIKFTDCAEPPKYETVVSDQKQPYICFDNEKVQSLDPQCVSHNSNCLDKMTEFAQQIIARHNKESDLLADFQNMMEMGKRVNLAQMEVNKARTQVRMAWNQVELARAFLMHQKYAEDSINVTTVKKNEQLGIRLANEIKILDVKALVSVESLSFSTSMTSSTKTLLPFVASVKTTDGEHKFIEFPIDFKRIDYSLTSASKLVIKTLFGTMNSRERRSTRSELVDDAAGQQMCVFSYQANAFFGDVIESLEFLLESTNVYFQTTSSGLQEFDSHSKNSREKSFPPNAQPLQVSFTLMMQSLKNYYVDITSRTTWESILEQWRGHLNVLTGEKNFTECSGSQDCVDYFFRNLDDLYQFEQSRRALEIKQQLHELKMIFVSLLQRNSSFAKVQEIAPRAKALLNNTKDDSVLCGASPIIIKSSPAEVVILAGETSNLTCLVENATEVAISWMKNERVLEDMNDEVLFLRNANTQTEGAYRCEVSNNRGRTLSNVTIVIVHKAPSITEHPRGMRVLLGTDTVSMECNSNGLPTPFTEWFFLPNTEEVVRLNSSDRVLIKKNLTSQDSGFYYCNVSNIHGTVKSKMARLDVLGFTPGKPRVAVSLKFAQCAAENFPENVSNCTDKHHTPALQYGALHKAFGEIIRKMSWSWKQIEKLNFSPQKNASVSFVITANETYVQSIVSPGVIDALNSFSLSRRELARELQSFRSSIQEGKFKFLSKNALVVARKGSFAARLFAQKCPAGKEADENGFLCVNCAPGFYGMSNGSCFPCPVGTYQPNEESRECLKCPYRLSLTELGAVLESQCIDISIPCNLSEVTTEHAQAPREKKDRYRTGETFILGCEDGYKGIGNGTWECNEGNWTKHEFYCEKTCFPPWTELKKRCYLVIDVPSHRWKNAFAGCQPLNGSQMVTINSEKENDFAAQLAKVYLKKNNMTQVQMWLGLRKVDARAQFQWVDGRFLSNTNWSPGKPSNDLGLEELCAEMLVFGNRRSHKWNDVRCDTPSYKSITVCEKPLRTDD